MLKDVLDTTFSQLPKGKGIFSIIIYSFLLCTANPESDLVHKLLPLSIFPGSFTLEDAAGFLYNNLAIFQKRLIVKNCEESGEEDKTAENDDETEDPIFQTEELLGSLIEYSLLEFNTSPACFSLLSSSPSPGFYSINDLVQAYCRNLLQQTDRQSEESDQQEEDWYMRFISYTTKKAQWVN